MPAIVPGIIFRVGQCTPDNEMDSLMVTIISVIRFPEMGAYHIVREGIQFDDVTSAWGIQCALPK
jgi:hypothetical protein